VFSEKFLKYITEGLGPNRLEIYFSRRFVPTRS